MPSQTYIHTHTFKQPCDTRTTYKICIKLKIFFYTQIESKFAQNEYGKNLASKSVIRRLGVILVTHFCVSPRSLARFNLITIFINVSLNIRNSR